MAIITVDMDPSAPLAEEQRKELEALKDRPITYDEDCPPLTDEQIELFRKRVNKRLFYKGYRARVEFDYESHVLFGKIDGIQDLVTFESVSAKNIELEFQNAVDDYLAYCEESGKEAERESSLFEDLALGLNEAIDLYLEDYDEQAVREVLAKDAADEAVNEALHKRDTEKIKLMLEDGVAPEIISHRYAYPEDLVNEVLAETKEQ